MTAQEAESTSTEGTIEHGQKCQNTGDTNYVCLKKKFQDSNSMSSITSTSIVSCVREESRLGAMSGDDL